MLRRFLILAACLAALPALAQDDETEAFAIGGDSFRAGRAVTLDAPGTDDLFMAGERVTVSAPITGTAHLAGRAVTAQAEIGGDVYAVGDQVTLQGAVAGDATVSGRQLTVGDVGGDMRIAGATVALRGTVSGYALMAGEEITFDGVVEGDLGLVAGQVTWGEGARVGGTLTLYEETPGTLEVPDTVAPRARIERRQAEEWEGPTPPGWGYLALQFLKGVVVVAALGALIAAVVPDRLAEMRREVLARPFHTLWLGFLTQSAVIGAGVLFALTIIGLLLTPAMVVLALAGGFAGYVVATYAFGVGLFLAAGRDEPQSIGARAAAAGLGALVAGLIGLIPLLGWLFILALVLAGVGAITLRVLRPAFFVAPR